MAVLIVCGFFAWEKRDLFSAVTWLLVLLPALPASYFNLKHILLPMDPFEFLRATEPCNLAALVFYLIMAVYVICSALFGKAVSGILSILVSLSVLGLTFCAEKGAKRWGI